MNNRDELVRELRTLRKGGGLTVGKLRTAPSLLAAIGNTGSLTDAYETLRQRLLDLGDNIESRALRNALAVDMKDPSLLTGRRYDFAENEQRHADTVETYENRAIEEFVDRLPAAGDTQPDLNEWLENPLSQELVEDYADVSERGVLLAKASSELAGYLHQMMDSLQSETAIDTERGQLPQWLFTPLPDSLEAQTETSQQNDLGQFLAPYTLDPRTLELVMAACSIVEERWRWTARSAYFAGRLHMLGTITGVAERIYQPAVDLANERAKGTPGS